MTDSQGPSGRSATVLVALLAAAPAVGQGVGPGGPAAALAKLAGLADGGTAPVILSEAEVNGLLAGEPAAGWLAANTGLVDLRVRFFPGRAHFTGALPAARLPAPYGALAGGSGGRHPVDVTLRLAGEDGVGRGDVERGSLAGIELPPDLLAEILLEALAGNPAVREDMRSAIRAGTPFPLPWRIGRIEIRVGEVVLAPGGG